MIFIVQTLLHYPPQPLMGFCLGCTNIDIKFRIPKQNQRNVAKYARLLHFLSFKIASTFKDCAILYGKCELTPKSFMSNFWGSVQACVPTFAVLVRK